MKKSSLTAWALSGAVLLGHLSATAQDSGAAASAPQSSQSSMSQSSMSQDIDLLRKNIRSQKKQLIAANMPLTDTEAQKFWPVYDQYTAELVKINNDKYALIEEYVQSNGNMTDAQARQLVHAYSEGRCGRDGAPANILGKLSQGRTGEEGGRVRAD